jgi:hypothetical protein
VSHTCKTPDLTAWDYDEDWTCPDCGQDWFVGYDNLCHSCYRNDGRRWEKFGVGDGMFPLVSVARGGIRFRVVEE